MSRTQFRQFILVAVLGCLYGARVCFAQTDAATLSGRIVDAQGARVASAVVTIYARTARLRLTTRTDANGAYRFARLAPGEYLVEADARGFSPAAAHAVTLTRGQEATPELALDVAE